MLKQVFQLSKFPGIDTPTLRSNLRAHIFDGALFGFATSLISYNTILPVFIQQVGGSVVAVGSVPVLWLIGTNFPQAIVLRFMKTEGEIKPAVLKYGLLYRLSFLFAGLFTLFFVGHLDATVSVPLLLLFIFLIAVSGSFGVPPWFQIFAKTTPMKLRGKLQAVRQLLSSSLGILGGSLVTLILFVVPFPANFALLFIIAFVFTMFSFQFLRALIEPPISAGRPLAPVGGILSDGMAIVRRNKNFRNFLLADAFTLMSMSASGFYAVFAIEKFSLDASYAGTFTVIVMAGMVAGNIVFGYLADALGHKINLIVLAGSSALASAVAMGARNILVFGAVFVFMAWTTSLQGISRLSFVVELCSEAERPAYVGLTNTVTAPTLAVGILFGWIARLYGFELMFGLSALFGMIAVGWLWVKVTEPRYAGEGNRTA